MGFVNPPPSLFAGLCSAVLAVWQYAGCPLSDLSLLNGWCFWQQSLCGLFALGINDVWSPQQVTDTADCSLQEKIHPSTTTTCLAVSMIHKGKVCS